MQRRIFGRTGIEVPPIALGGFPFGGVNRAIGWDPFTDAGQQSGVATIRRALERGITYFDTAPSYGAGNSECIFGEALQGQRDSITLATKCPWNGDADSVLGSLEKSLARLRTDHVDILQLHGGMFTPDDVQHILDRGPRCWTQYRPVKWICPRLKPFAPRKLRVARRATDRRVAELSCVS